MSPLRLGPLVLTPPPGVAEWSAEIQVDASRQERIWVTGRVDLLTGVTDWSISFAGGQ